MFLVVRGAKPDPAAQQEFTSWAAGIDAADRARRGQPG